MPRTEQIDVYFDENQPPIRCVDVAEAEEALEQIYHQTRQNEPPVAVAIKVDGHEVMTGLRDGLTFVCVQIAPCDGEYYLAMGDGEGGDEVAFYGAGQDSYWKPRNLIPLATALAAVRYFIEHRELDPHIRWQDHRGRQVSCRQVSSNQQ